MIISTPSVYCTLLIKNQLNFRRKTLQWNETKSQALKPWKGEISMRQRTKDLFIIWKFYSNFFLQNFEEGKKDEGSKRCLREPTEKREGGGLKSNPCSYDNRSLSSNGGFRADSSILDIQVTETVILSRKQNYGYFNETQASHILIKMSLEFVRQNNQNNLASYCQGKQSSVETEDITLQY